jgi:hypothetical protein
MLVRPQRSTLTIREQSHSLAMRSCTENEAGNQGHLLKRLGRRQCCIFCFCAEREGVLVEGSGVLGELEYDDDDDDEMVGPLDCL